MNAVSIGLTTASIGAIIVLAIVIKDYQRTDKRAPSSCSEGDDILGIGEDGCRDMLVFIAGILLVAVGLLTLLIAWIFSLT